MKRWSYIVLGAILIGGVVYIYLHRQELGIVGPPAATSDDASSATADQSASSARPAHIVWQKVDRTPDGFKVEMPTDIKQIQIPAYNASGESEQVDMIYSYPNADTSFSVSWAANPPVARATGTASERTLDTARDDALARTQSTLTGESHNNRLGFPARDFSARNAGGGVFSARLILAGNRLYMLIAAFPSSTARRDQDVARFFDSFSVTSNSKNN